MYFVSTTKLNRHLVKEPFTFNIFVAAILFLRISFYGYDCNEYYIHFVA